jgi:hypothetical protein
VSKEKPGIAGRLGQMIYWFGCTLAVLAALLALVFFSGNDDGKFLGGILIVAALLIWLLGRGARYILKGD